MDHKIYLQGGIVFFSISKYFINSILCMLLAIDRHSISLHFVDKWQSSKNPKEFAESLKREAQYYNGFNLVIADITSKSMVYISNRPKGQPITVQEVPPGLHVLSNAKLNSPWHKVC